jgi:hypothetical protein
MDRKEGEKDLTGERGFLVRGVQMVIHGEAPMGGDGEEDTYGMQLRTVSSYV